jgi:hypothetical protein
MPGNGYIRNLFGLAPAPNIAPEGSDGTSSDSLDDENKKESMEEAPQQVVVIRLLDLLGMDDYLLRVHRVLNLRTHVVVVVQESTHLDFVVGSERVLTMDEAVKLYRQYHNIY